MENENTNLNNQPTDTANPPVNPPPPVETPQPKSNRSLVIFLVFLVIVLAGTTSYFAYQSFNQSNNFQTPTQPTPTVTTTPNPTTSPPTISPEPSQSPTTEQTQQAKLVSTDNWKSISFGSLSAQVPEEADINESNCTDERYTTYEECYQIKNHDKNLMSPEHDSITIKVKEYQGGSRRKEAGLTENPGSYTYTEKLFSNNKGLEAVFNCEISECRTVRQIMLVVDNKLIFITDGIYRQGGSGTLDDSVNTSLEGFVTNTIISTIN